MKKIFLLFFVCVMSATTFAQNDVTTFLGIPVDGTKSEMRKKLIEKGFEPKKLNENEIFKGEFNGFNVTIHIVTNNNKVCRLMVADENNLDEYSIKVRFNKLVSQFKNNKRYVSYDDFSIADDVDISYEMKIKDKKFEALFFQIADSKKIEDFETKSVIEKLRSKYTLEELQNPTEEIEKEIEKAGNEILLEKTLKKPVWFTISEVYGKYYITMYYDNEYNRANGEDL